MTTLSPDAPPVPSSLAAVAAEFVDRIRLADIAAEFPLHSDWRPVSPGSTASGLAVVVVGYGRKLDTVLLEAAGLAPWHLGVERVRSCYERVPAPPPCPITESVTVRRSITGLGDDHWHPDNCGVAITLHPPGADLDAYPAECMGYYTWAARP